MQMSKVGGCWIGTVSRPTVFGSGAVIGHSAPLATATTATTATTAATATATTTATATATTAAAAALVVSTHLKFSPRFQFLFSFVINDIYETTQAVAKQTNSGGDFNAFQSKCKSSGHYPTGDNTIAISAHHKRILIYANSQRFMLIYSYISDQALTLSVV